MKVFISYKWESQSHNRWVEQLARDLRSKGIDALLDRWEVKLGESFSEYMTHAINTADAFLFIMTPASVQAAETSPPKMGAVKFEVQLATARRIAGEKFRFIGILRKGSQSAAQLRDCRYADFRKANRYPQMLDVLVRDLLGVHDKPPLPEAIPGFKEGEKLAAELNAIKLSARFTGPGRDIVVWQEDMSGPDSPMAYYRENAGTYRREPLSCVGFATRIATSARPEVLVVQEREGVFVVHDNRIRASLSIGRIAEPIIRSEAVHPIRPVIAVGTDYGKIVAWNYEEDRILFAERYFPREQIVWITGLAFDERQEHLLFSVSNILYRVRLSDGSIVSKETFGGGDEEEETGAIAVSTRFSCVAVGTPINARVHGLKEGLPLLYQITIGSPLVTRLNFSDDGSLLGVVYGGFGGGGALVVETVSGKVLAKFTDISVAKSSFRVRSTQVETVSFSADSSFAAIGEGARIGLYSR